VIRAAGLEPRIVDVDSFAFLNCFEMNYRPAPEECVALVNIGGRDHQHEHLLQRGLTLFARDIPIGAR